MFVTPAYPNETSLNGELLEGIAEIISSLKTGDFALIKAEHFGTAAVAAGNAERIKKDISITVTIAMLILITFISLFFRKKRIVFIIFLPVLIGGIFSIAALALIKTEISAMSLGIGSVLLGISVDFALHIFAHYREHGSVEGVLKDLSTPILMSALTTASAFVCLFFVTSEALNDLGLFAAVSVITAALVSLIVLPHLLSSIKTKPDKAIPNNTWIDKLAAYNYHKNKVLIFIISLLSFLFIFTSQHVLFESDMMKNNYMSEDLTQAEHNLNKITSVSQKTIYLIATGKDLNEALDNNETLTRNIETLKNEGIVSSAMEISPILRSELSQQRRIDKWNSYWSPEKKRQVENALEEAKKKYKFSQSAFSQFSNLINKSFKPIQMSELDELRQLFLDNYIIKTDDLTAVINLLKVERNGKDADLVYEAFSAKPDNIWVLDKQMLTEEFVEVLKENFNTLITISLLVVFGILVFALGRIELGLITFFPMILSWVWTIGIMGIFGIKFNIFNIIISTFIFGLGIDYSIFIMRGLLQNYKFGTTGIASYKVSVILSAFTTIVGIGVLIFAKHPALKSIALLSIIGILSVTLITFTVQPILFKILVEYKKGKRIVPITATNFLISIITFLIFLAGAILLTILIPLFVIFPGRSKNKKLAYHYFLMSFARIIVSVSIFSKKKIINDHGEDYKKQAIIIANHQSHIDLMFMMMLTPKLIILTNDWVWNNVFYGFVVRYAEYYPISSGYEEAVDKLKTKVDEGYSILIFPEGTRSETGKVRRFHKGAFYLADKLKLEILPIMIHGANSMMQKKEFFLKRGDITIKVLNRIDLSKNKHGDTYAQQAKSVVREFRKEFDDLKREVETPDFFKDLLIKNYTYKGPMLEWYLRVKIRLEKNYKFFDDIIPKSCSIVDIGCGYGFLSYMLNLTSSERKITGVDYDEDKIRVANNCALKNPDIHFISKDITEYDFPEADVFVLNDVLHYLPAELQIDTVEKCIQKLHPDGMILIRDADIDLKNRHMGTRYTEFFSTNFGFNKTKHKLSFLSKRVIEELVEKHSLKMETIDKTLFTSNLIYVIRKS